jgi:hypothetical protein
MKKVASCTSYLLGLLFVLGGAHVACAAQLETYQHGTVVRMRMSECLPAHRGLMVAFGAPAMPDSAEVCPEYTLVSEKVVFVIVGRSSGELVPLAEVIDFRLRNNELAVRIDDARHESRFSIKEMILRSEWDRLREHMDEQLGMSAGPTDATINARTGD